MTFYDILGVPRHASQDEIRLAYRDLARRLHPDALGDVPAAARAEAEEKLKAVNAAFKALGDPVRRQAYHRLMWTRHDPARQYRFRPETDAWVKNGHTDPGPRSNGNAQAAATIRLEIQHVRAERDRLRERQEVKRRRLWIGAGLTSLVVYFLMAIGARLFPSPDDLLPLTVYFLGNELITLSLVLNASGLRLPHFPNASSPVAFSALGAVVTWSAIPRSEVDLAAPASLFSGMTISTALLIHAFMATRLARLQEALFAEEIRRIDKTLDELEQRLKRFDV